MPLVILCWAKAFFAGAGLTLWLIFRMGSFADIRCDNILRNFGKTSFSYSLATAMSNCSCPRFEKLRATPMALHGFVCWFVTECDHCHKAVPGIIILINFFFVVSRYISALFSCCCFKCWNQFCPRQSGLGARRRWKWTSALRIEYTAITYYVFVRTLFQNTYISQT